MRKRGSPHGFTLIELLVVIAIIALLISLLLPSLGKVRKAGWLTISQANTRSICTAAFSYQGDSSGFMPLMAPKTPRGSYPERDPTTGKFSSIAGWATWTFGGKNCNGIYAKKYSGLFDCEAQDRPLNTYITELVIPGPDDPTKAMPPAAQERNKFQLPVFKDPSDKVGHQWDWPDPNTTVSPNVAPLSCYDDVGVSYQFNMKWWDQMLTLTRGDWGAAFFGGGRRIRVADAFVPSRFVWMNDEWADIAIYAGSTTYRVRNGYGDYNKSILGFMDGHAAYLEVFPGGEAKAYDNDKYTVVFNDLPAPV